MAAAQALAIKIKTLDDATSAAVAQIKAAQLSFAMLARLPAYALLRLRGS